MKRLVVCCDGTWQKLESPYPTNVVKMAQAVKPTASDGTPQIIFYDEGIGTRNQGEHLFGGAFGSGIDENIQDAYRFLALNYDEGDEIYLFGFSRGSYTVRSIVGMIYCSGLLPRYLIRKAPEAYKFYHDRDEKTSPSSEAAIAWREERHSKQVPITLLACWDTVGSLGIPDVFSNLKIDKKINDKYKFHDTQLNRTVQNALHAVAIDEHRKVFDVTPMTPSPNNPDQRVLQVWFPGDHGCVGGGSEEQHHFSDATLQWMIDSIKKLGLGLDLDTSFVNPPIEYDALRDFNISQSMLDKFTQLGGKHYRQVVHTIDDLHESVIERWQKVKPYRPQNLKDFADKLDAFVKNL